MPSTELPFFEIRKSGIAGRGAFALRRIPKGKRLIEYTGERVSHEVADARYDEEERQGNTHTVLFAVDDKIVIDANVDGNDARYFNHSYFADRAEACVPGDPARNSAGRGTHVRLRDS
jgi:SET domain-containing protein